MMPPSGSGRSAPLAAMGVAMRKDLQTPQIQCGSRLWLDAARSGRIERAL